MTLACNDIDHYIVELYPQNPALEFKQFLEDTV